MKKALLIILLLVVKQAIYSQNVGVGTVTPTHTLHVVPTGGGDPLRVEGLQLWTSGTNLMVVDPTNGIVKYMPASNLLPNIDSIVINNMLTHADTLFSNVSFVDSIKASIYNYGDTLLYNQFFVDSLISIMRDSVDTDVDSLTLQGSILTVYENGDSSSVNIASLGLDSTFINNVLGNTYFTDSIYTLNRDSLLGDTLFVDSLKSLIDSDVDSLTLQGSILTVYENGDSSSVNIASLGLDSTFINNVLGNNYFTDSIFTLTRDSLLGDTLFVDSLKSLIDSDIDSADYINDTLTIYEDGNAVKVRIVPSDSIIAINYDSIKTLVDSSWLIPGKKYLITDFQTLHIIPNTTDRNDANLTIPIEPIIVTAMQPNQLDVRAHSTVYPKDLIYYTIDNAWWGDLVDPDSKGAITYRKSSLEDSLYTNVAIPQDFRAVVLRRWNVDLTTLTNVASNYVLYNTSVSIGRDHGTNNSMTLNAVSTGDYTDHFMFDTNYVIKDVELGRKRWWGTNNNIINAVFKSHVRDVNIKTADEWHCEWQIMHLHGGEVTSTINASSPFSLANPGTEIWHQNEENIGSFRSVFVNVSAYWNGYYQNLQGVTIVQDTSSFFSNYRPFLSNGFIKDVLNGSIKLKNLAPNRPYDVQVSNLKGCGHSMTLASSNIYHPSIVKDLHYAGLVNDCSSAIYDFSNQDNLKIQYIGGVASSIESTKAATANLNSVRNSWTQYDELAGIYNLTGTGVVNINTITSTAVGELRVPLLLKPDSGLTIIIAPNNVPNGFIHSEAVTANGTFGEVIQLEWKYDRWNVMSGRIDNSYITSISFDSVKTLRDSGDLIPGKRYIINDYQTLHIIPQTSTQNDAVVSIPVEPLIVTALDTNLIDRRVQSTLFPEDIIEYTLDNSYLFLQAHPNGKGVITYREKKINGPFTQRNYVLKARFDFRNTIFATWHTDSLASISGVPGFTNKAVMWKSTPITIGSNFTDESGFILGSNGNVTYTRVFALDIDSMGTFGGITLGDMNNNVVFFPAEGNTSYQEVQGDWSRYKNMRNYGIVESDRYGDEMQPVSTGNNIIGISVNGAASRLSLSATRITNLLNLGKDMSLRGETFDKISFVPEISADFWTTLLFVRTPSTVRNVCFDGRGDVTGRGFGNTTNWQELDNVYNLKWRGGVKANNANRFNIIKNIYNAGNTSYVLTSADTDGSYIDGKSFNAVTRSITPSAGTLTIGFDNSITGIIELPAGTNFSTLTDVNLFAQKNNLDRTFRCLGAFTLQAGGNIKIPVDKVYASGDVFVLRKVVNEWVLMTP